MTRFGIELNLEIKKFFFQSKKFRRGEEKY